MEVFSLRVAVLARPKGVPIKNQRAEYFLILLDPRIRREIIDLLYDLSNTASIVL